MSENESKSMWQIFKYLEKAQQKTNILISSKNCRLDFIRLSTANLLIKTAKSQIREINIKHLKQLNKKN